jgi:hypothetical protein
MFGIKLAFPGSHAWYSLRGLQVLAAARQEIRNARACYFGIDDAKGTTTSYPQQVKMPRLNGQFTETRMIDSS